MFKNPKKSVLFDQDYDALYALFKTRWNFSLSSYRKQMVQRRVLARMQKLGLNNVNEYLDYLKKYPQEFEGLIKSLCVPVTSFFRDAQTFKAIEQKVIDPIIQNHRKSRALIKVWSAGTSSGEEAYSLAILFLEKAPEIILSQKLQIWATDLDQKAIAIAQIGEYSQDKVKNLNPHLLKKYFDRTQIGWKVKPFLKQLVRFEQKDILKSEALDWEGLDLILCRNLLIYFDEKEQKKIVEKFIYALRKEGFLVLGRVEFLPDSLSRFFKTIDERERIFQKLS